jgi:16S rRNA (adenine1518-N6/adenine1519-N6)-dimethyltransferase
MPDPLKAQSVLRSYGILPKKKLGQNFIINQFALDQVMEAADLGVREQILEIGAGLGVLTLSLARQGHIVHAIEFDPRLIPILKDILNEYSNVNILHADILQLELKEILAPPSYLVVANIPYQITSAVIRKLIETPYPARRVVLTIQKEVAERIIARPGEMSLLALSVQLYGKPSIHAHIPASAFYPRPKVDSSVLTIESHAEPKIEAGGFEPIFRIARAGFSQKRKKLRNALAGGLQISVDIVEETMAEAGISASRRAQELDLDQWKRLAEAFKGID